jgi:predicted nucleotidyltransferase component of viral defense system
MLADYPVAFDDIRDWATSRGVTEAEARVRFAQYGILLAISLSRELRRLLVFKGGNALDFIWQPNRSTTDLDFSVDMPPDALDVDVDRLRVLFDGALTRAGRALNIAYRTQRMKRNPPGAAHTFATYEMKIAYALQDQPLVILMIERQQSAPHVIDLDISLNDVICATADVAIGGSHPLRTCTIEDIVAEKLRALLQQPIRRRNRAQDLLDIAVCLRGVSTRAVDQKQVGAFLLQKAAARNVPVSITAFHAEELIRRTHVGYAELRSTTRATFVSFEDALAELHEFVATLSIPAE